MSYYLFIHEDVRGPYAEGELRDMLEHRDVTPDIQVCPAGGSNWTTLGDLFNRSSARTATVPRLLPVPVVETEPDLVGSYGPADPELSRPGKPSERHVPLSSEGTQRRGIGRGLFFLCALVQTVGYNLVLLPSKAIPLNGAVVLIFLGMACNFMRLRNMRVNGWYALFRVVPLANTILDLYCLTAPPNYGATRRYDSLGKALVLVYGTIILLDVSGVL
jgi:hypothetical protein